MILVMLVSAGFIVTGIITIIEREIGIGHPNPVRYVNGRPAIWIGISLILLGLIIAILPTYLMD
jgi:hypothetical protein